VEDGDGQQADFEEPDDQQRFEAAERTGVEVAACLRARRVDADRSAQHRDVGEQVAHEHPAGELVEYPGPHPGRELPPPSEILDGAAIVRLTHTQGG